MKATNGVKRKTSPARERKIKPLTEVVPHVVRWDGIDTPNARHQKRKLDISKRPPMSDSIKQRWIDAIRAGSFPTELCDSAKYPTRRAFMREIERDKAFGDLYREAVSDMADLLLEDAALFARDASGTGSIDQQRTADVYIRSISHILEKLAPKTHGVLVKHAGSDGGQLSVTITNFAGGTNERKIE